jgi:uncharacterized protein
MSATRFPEPIGWPLLPVPDADGALHWPDLARSVRDSIQVLLATRPGEQLMRPGFGAGLENLLGEPNTVTTRSRIQSLVKETLERHETRIVLDAVSVAPTTSQGVADGVRVEIAYRLKRTGTPARVGLTLVMEARRAD